MRDEPITRQNLEDLEPLIQLYIRSGFRLTVKRILGVWMITPSL